ncbi:MAG: hypothetical protein WDM76_01735 [Limisphaerales bacterium]
MVARSYLEAMPFKCLRPPPLVIPIKSKSVGLLQQPMVLGAPGSSVFIFAPTNGSLGAGTINALKNVTIGQLKYIVGDAYPFRWFNAGDFGNTNLENADVAQVFQSAIYQLNYPPFGSDFFDVMDSCGFTYIDNGNGYLEPNLATDPNYYLMATIQL